MAIAEYGKEKEEWLRTFLELANGIPSVDTFEGCNLDLIQKLRNNRDLILQ